MGWVLGCKAVLLHYIIRFRRRWCGSDRWKGVRVEVWIRSFASATDTAILIKPLLATLLANGVLLFSIHYPLNGKIQDPTPINVQFARSVPIISPNVQWCVGSLSSAYSAAERAWVNYYIINGQLKLQKTTSERNCRLYSKVSSVNWCWADV